MNNSSDAKKKSTIVKPGGKLKDKIHRHLSDKNDIITEEDIRDILSDTNPPENDLPDTKKSPGQR